MITGDVKEFDPTLFKWMAFLTGYVLPEGLPTPRSGAEGFEQKPIGTGPYMVEDTSATRSCGCRPSRNIGAPKPAFETVDHQVRARRGEPRRRGREPASREVTFDIPYEEYDRLKARKALPGDHPVSDIG